MYIFPTNKFLTAFKLNLLISSININLNNFLIFKFFNYLFSMVKARLKEAMRLARQFSKKTLVYIRYVYSDTKKPLSEVMKFFSSIEG